MPRKERISVVRGLPVYTVREGRRLGTVEHILLDAKAKCLAGISMAVRRSELGFVPMDKVSLLGEDAVLVVDGEALGPMPDPAPGPNLKDLQGLWVTSLEGSHVGTLVDLDIGDDGVICELRMADDKVLPVDGKTLTVGGDSVLVPADAKDKVVETTKERRGLLSRVFGAESTDEITTAIQRVLKRAAPKLPQEELEDDKE